MCDPEYTNGADSDDKQSNSSSLYRSVKRDSDSDSSRRYGRLQLPLGKRTDKFNGDRPIGVGKPDCGNSDRRKRMYSINERNY